MNQYNDRWTRDKYLEYRTLKRNGYTHKMLKEHFGDDIYYSGIYNKNGSKKLSILDNYIKEIKITPIENSYKLWVDNNLFYRNKFDYFIEFNSKNNNKYVLWFNYNQIGNIETYDISFTIYDVFNDVFNGLKNVLKNRKLTSDDISILKNIYENETNLKELYDIMKRLSFIIFDVYDKHLIGKLLSIGDTDNKVKIKMYRNIIKDSFHDIEEEYMDGYFIYKIKNK
jgi:hypothetical protein